MAKMKQSDGKNQEPKSGTAQPSRAKYSYPYFNMQSSLDVARAVHENGGGSCTPDQLAAFLGYKSVKSGTYQTRTSASRQFGFIRSGNGEIAITDRAQKILNPVMPEDEASAKTEAFLAVELFSAVYEKFQGSTLPPEAGLKNLLTQTYGLSKDRVGPAIRVLTESAEQAGFFKTTGDRSRLIKPAIKSSGQKHKPGPPQEPEHPSEERQKSLPTGGMGGEPPGVHSAIIGLLRELPSPGVVWKKSKKDAFKAAFAATLDFIYPTDGEETNEE